MLMRLAGRQLQLFNLGTKQKVGAHLMNDDIPFWTWVNDTTLGIVTDREVYHWKVMEGQTAPTKVRRGQLTPFWTTS
jgi:clathrin heavy chain